MDPSEGLHWTLFYDKFFKLSSPQLRNEQREQVSITAHTIAGWFLITILTSCWPSPESRTHGTDCQLPAAFWRPAAKKHTQFVINK